MGKLRRLAFGLIVAFLTLSVGIGLAVYVKRRSHAARCAKASYFPNVDLGENQRRVGWFGKMYMAQLEQPFTCFDENVEVYRLLFLPAFEYPTSIRIWREGDRHQIAVKRLVTDEVLDFSSRDLKVNVIRTLTIEEWNHFQQLLQKANFWSMQSKDVREPGLDGVTFLLEGKKTGQYHVVDRWFPDHDENFLNACGYLVDLAKLEWKHRPDR